MTSKWSPRKILTDHLSTLIDARTRKVRIRDYLEFYFAPLVLGVVSWYFEFRFENTDPILSGTSIFTGLLFGVLVYVFQLRVRVKDSTALAGDSRLLQFIDEVEANVSYAVLIGLVLSGTLIGLSATKQKDVSISAVGSAVTIFLLVHFVLTVLLVLRRTRAAYARVTE